MSASFKEELRALLNRCSRENESDTPDYILAGFLSDCLEAFEGAVVGARESLRGQS